MIKNLHALAFWLGRKLYMIGRLEPRNSLSTSGEFDLQNWVASTLDWPFTVIDVGANVGDWTVHFMKVALQVIPDSTPNYVLVEPIPETFSHLEKRFRGQSHVTILQSAVGASSGTALMEAQAMSPLNRIISDRHDDESSTRVQVPVVTLDHLLHQWPDTEFVKIDAEGFDFEVLLGGQDQLTAGHQPAFVQFEYNHRWLAFGHSLLCVFKLFANTNYTLCKIHPRGLIRLDEWHPELDKFFDSNYVLVIDSALSGLPVQASRFNSRNVWLVG